MDLPEPCGVKGYLGNEEGSGESGGGVVILLQLWNLTAYFPFVSLSSPPICAQRLILYGLNALASGRSIVLLLFEPHFLAVTVTL
jgi:hypothetical protein